MDGLKRGDLRLLPGAGCVVLDREGTGLPLDAGELRWLVLVAGPAALAAGMTVEEPASESEPAEAVLF